MNSYLLKATATILVVLLATPDWSVLVSAGLDYKDALTKSLLFLEAQRSGQLLENNRISWRGDSALNDGMLANVDLIGGYYDAGDNVKFGFPMAFTITTLAWSAIHYESELQSSGELGNVQDAIRWGTDYFLKCSANKNQLYIQVGEPNADHACWVRPENMPTPRTVYVINENQPGTEIAAETAAALAASSMVFSSTDPAYAQRLLDQSESLFDFAKTYKGSSDAECPFYCSFSGYNDELLWAASWLYMATKRDDFYKYITEEAISASVDTFGWDTKYAGAQVLLSQENLQVGSGIQNFKQQADDFVCAVLPDTPLGHIHITPGGMIYVMDGANSQVVTGISFLFMIYSDVLTSTNQKVSCGNQQIEPDRLKQFAKQQMDYLLGSNPLGRSYMVGFGSNPPTHAHHRGASVPVLRPGTPVNCAESFAEWFATDIPDVHELTGAIVGGPDKNDYFVDKRTNSSYTEPTTYINSMAVGPLAWLAMHT